MNKNLTEIICIIDRSGSMQSIKHDAIGGFNAFIAEQEKVEGEAKLTLVLFNHSYEKPFDHAPLADVSLNDETFVPKGTTALYDAIGRTIDDVGERLAETPEDERPAQVIVAILTDGHENASKDYTNANIGTLIEQQQEKYSWEFIFLAANQDAFATGGKLRMRRDNIANFEASSEGVFNAMAGASHRVTKMRTKNAKK